MSTPLTPVSPEDISTGAMVAGLAIFAILMGGFILDIWLLRRWRKSGVPAPKYAERLLQRHWHWQDALWLGLVMAVFITGLAVISKLLQMTSVDFSPSTTRAVVILQNFVTQGLSLGLVLYLQRRSGTTLAESLGGPPAALHTRLGGPPAALHTRLGQALIFYIAAMPVIAAAAMLSNAVFSISGMSMAPQPVLGGFIDTTVPVWFKGWLVVTAVAAAPLIEETVFRGVFFPAMARHNGIPNAIVTVSMLFAFIHGHPPSVLPLFAVGVTLALSYLYTGSLLVPILIHSIFNTVNLTALMLSGITYTP